jgi:RNA polymerase sigma factor (sigma-70 family)
LPAPPIREAELDLLMSRLARGDRTAFDGLYAALGPRALRFARLRVGDGDAADVAQEALERVFARASDFTPGRPCLPWFYAILGNELRANRRRRARLVLDETASTSVVAPDPDAEATLLQRELERALESAVAELDAGAAAAIAALLGHAAPPDVKPATLRKRLSRAYAKLRLLLGGDHVG